MAEATTTIDSLATAFPTRLSEAKSPDILAMQNLIKIQLDSFAGNVSIHPVPPYSRARTLGGILKSALERIGSALRRRAARSQQQRDA